MINEGNKGGDAKKGDHKRYGQGKDVDGFPAGGPGGLIGGAFQTQVKKPTKGAGKKGKK